MKVKLGIDLAKCSGCRVCELICALVNHRQNNPKLAHIKIIGQFPEPGGYKIKFKDCTRCGECAMICPQKAIFLKPSFASAFAETRKLLRDKEEIK